MHLQLWEIGLVCDRVYKYHEFMIHSFIKVIVVVATIIALLGQSVAFATMSCDMMMSDAHMSMSHKPMDISNVDHEAMTLESVNHENMNHSGMTHSAMSNTSMMDNMSEDCCDTECICPTNACSSISCLSTGHYTAFDRSSTDAEPLHLHLLPHNFVSSLYRPPITA